MPFVGIERGEKIVELAGVGVEIDLGGQPLDQPVELVGVLLHEPAWHRRQLLHLSRRRLAGKNVRHQGAQLRAVECGPLAAPKPVEARIEFALEPVDHDRIEAGEAFLTEQLVEPVLPLDQEMQAALAVFHVEGQQVLHPGRELIRGLRFEFERCAVRARVDDALAHRPGVDDLGDHARQRGLRRHARAA